MEEARQVLERLARVEALDRRHAPPADVLDELRALVREAESWLRAEREPHGAVEALLRCRTALEARREEAVPLTR